MPSTDQGGIGLVISEACSEGMIERATCDVAVVQSGDDDIDHTLYSSISSRGNVVDLYSLDLLFGQHEYIRLCGANPIDQKLYLPTHSPLEAVVHHIEAD